MIILDGSPQTAFDDGRKIERGLAGDNNGVQWRLCADGLNPTRIRLPIA
jgi:hypothetical protein